MTKRKKIIWGAVSTLAILAFIVWYTLPVLNFMFIMKDTLPDITPKQITALPEAPAEWDEIDIGSLKLKVPLSDVKKISGMADTGSIYFRFNSHLLNIFDIAETKEYEIIRKKNKLPYPITPYSQMLGAAKASLTDISIFNSRTKNLEASLNLILKAIMANNAYEIAIVAIPNLKAIVVKNHRKDVYSALASIYSQSENNSLSIITTGFKSKQEMDTFLLRIIGGLIVPNKRLDIDIVREDIQKLIERHENKDA